MHTVLGNHF